ncbi:alpha/beta hydrolase [Spiroplasma endosymbiont of Othius punctulatus]|uniref:alpha/beta hydrolase n=1 Tax=Spiroplasma endosymbiont of Othius punctulatus TaxID=3066289 RepID=UPI0030D267DB
MERAKYLITKDIKKSIKKNKTQVEQLSNDWFLKYSQHLNDFQKEGLNESGVELNTFEHHLFDNRSKRINHVEFDKNELQEFNVNHKNKLVSVVGLINRSAHRWVIGLHDWSENKYQSLRMLEQYRKNGYNIISFDTTGHGKDLNEKTDLWYSTISTIDEIIRNIKDNYLMSQVGLVGVGFGASAAIAHSEIGKKKSSVNWIIADSPISDLDTYFKYDLQNNFTNMDWWKVSFNFLDKFKRSLEIKYDFDILKDIKKSFKTPIMFIASTNNKKVPHWMTEELYENKIKFEKEQISELWLTNKSEHQKIVSDFGKEYMEKTFNFSSKWEK